MSRYRRAIEVRDARRRWPIGTGCLVWFTILALAPFAAYALFLAVMVAAVWVSVVLGGGS